MAAKNSKADWVRIAPQLIESDLAQMWESLSTDEKMTNFAVERKFLILRRIISTIRDCHGRPRRPVEFEAQSNKDTIQLPEEKCKTMEQNMKSLSEKE